MEKQQIIQLLSGTAGSVGFGLIFNLRKKYLPLVAAGGFLGWLVYLLCSRYIWEGVFLPTLAASFATAIFAEVLARVCHAPSTLFFLTAVIPLVPGRTLYYCIDALVQNEPEQAQRYGTETFLYALAIAAGMAIAWTLCDFSRKIGKAGGTGSSGKSVEPEHTDKRRMDR